MADHVSFLNSIYKDVTKGSAFGGARELQAAAKKQGIKIPLKAIKEYLLQQPSHVQFKPLRRRFMHNKMQVETIHQYWHMDLLEVSAPLVHLNRKTRYILIICDALSRMIFAEPLTSKKGAVVAAGLERIFERTQLVPANIISDQGGEFISKETQDVLQKRDIVYLPASRSQYSKSFLAENAVKIVSRRLYKYMTDNKTKIFYPVFQKLIDGLNARKLRSLNGLAPIEITPENQSLLEAKQRKKRDAQVAEKANFSVRDRVLLAKKQGAFSKAYKGTFDPELLTISKVLFNRGHRPMYQLSDQFGNPILGSFYEEQITLTSDKNELSDAA